MNSSCSKGRAHYLKLFSYAFLQSTQIRTVPTSTNPRQSHCWRVTRDPTGRNQCSFSTLVDIDCFIVPNRKIDNWGMGMEDGEMALYKCQSKHWDLDINDQQTDTNLRTDAHTCKFSISGYRWAPGINPRNSLASQLS